MSNLGIIIEERAADIGNFLVGRLLPFRQKRSVGPFVFLDHMGPATLGPDENFDVGPHPHIGLSTLTYLFEGAVMHRDSIGSECEITPGAVNWMTAGRGVVHSERTPDRLKGKPKSLHGLQIWVALPRHLEDCDPSFFHISESELPAWEEGGVAFRLIAGQFGDKASGVPVHSPLYMLEIRAKDKAVVNIGNRLFGEAGLYILEGNVITDGQAHEPKRILVAKDANLCSFEMTRGTTVYVFGGEALPEPRFMDWNFVHSDKAIIERAKEDWRHQRFPQISGETDYVPLPERKI
jgi:redox-sensitive bicupin YhaK (pirin superfamily)